MPYKLKTPQTAPPATAIRITSFAYAAEPDVMRVEFVAESANGLVLERGSESFDADALALVDKRGELRAGIKAALYAMFATSRNVLGSVE